jgi:hypothetical protein
MVAVEVKRWWAGLGLKSHLPSRPLADTWDCHHSGIIITVHKSSDTRSVKAVCGDASEIKQP